MKNQSSATRRQALEDSHAIEVLIELEDEIKNPFGPARKCYYFTYRAKSLMQNFSLKQNDAVIVVRDENGDVTAIGWHIRKVLQAIRMGDFEVYEKLSKFETFSIPKVEFILQLLITQASTDEDVRDRLLRQYRRRIELDFRKFRDGFTEERFGIFKRAFSPQRNDVVSLLDDVIRYRFMAAELNRGVNFGKLFTRYFRSDVYDSYSPSLAHLKDLATEGDDETYRSVIVKYKDVFVEGIQSSLKAARPNRYRFGNLKSSYLDARYDEMLQILLQPTQ